MNEKMVLQMCGITKSFSGVEVLHSVDFSLKKGETHVLIGENGAGKSTLMKILCGVYTKDKGEISLIDDNGELQKVEIVNPREALVMGISMVFQEFNLINDLTIAENIYLGHEPKTMGLLDKGKLNRDATNQLKKVGLDLSPTTLVSTLTTAQKQCVEIAKCLSQDAKIIILDEPTSSLSEKEVTTLFELIGSLKQRGISIVYISHRMEEIFELGDRITVFRDGYMIDTVNASETDENELIKMIVGREFTQTQAINLEKAPKEVMLSGENISVGKFKKRLDFKAHTGEILGIFGLVGAGRTELARVIFGIDGIGEGRLYKKEKPISIRNPSEAIRQRIGLVPEDRKEQGLITMLNVQDNLTLIKLRELSWILSSKAEESRITHEYIKKMSIVTQGPNQIIDRLSGGNQQKVTISKWLSMNLDILILDEPTRGVDVGAKAEIYEIIRTLARDGMCIIMISSDLPEILRVSHRVLVMHEGEIKLDAPTSELEQESIMQAAMAVI